jgi:hypothetical protein
MPNNVMQKVVKSIAISNFPKLALANITSLLKNHAHESTMQQLSDRTM